MKAKDLKELFSAGVSVVGNAESITLGEKNGEVIDSRVTIRFNWIVLNHPEYTGKRKDVIATNIPNKIKDTGYSILIGSKADRRYKFFQYPNELIRTIQKKSGKKASNGLRIIWLLDHLEIKDVHIYGFDWKKTHSLVEGKNKSTPKSEHHNYNKEEAICRELIEKNGWVLY